MQEQSQPESVHLIWNIDSAKREQSARATKAINLETKEHKIFFRCQYEILTIENFLLFFFQTRGVVSYLRAEESVLVEPSLEEVTVLPRRDVTVALDTMATRSTNQLTGTVIASVRVRLRIITTYWPSQ